MQAPATTRPELRYLDLFAATTLERYWSAVADLLDDLGGSSEFTFTRRTGRPGVHELVHSSSSGATIEGKDGVQVVRDDSGARLDIGGESLPVIDEIDLEEASQGSFSMLWIHALERPLPEDQRIDLARALGRSFAWCRHWTGVHRQLLTSEAKLDAINRIGETIGTLDVEVLLARLMEISLFICSSQVGLIVLVEDGRLESRVEWGLSLTLVESLCYSDGNSILESVMSTQEAIHIHDFQDEAHYQPCEAARISSLMCVPLIAKGRVIGAICLIGSEGMEETFTEVEMETLRTVAGLAATAIENARLHQEAIERERMTAQLRVAQDIQQGLYPTSAPEVPGLEISWVHSSCDETGGDYFDFIYRTDPDPVLDLVIGDVSGHGIGSALLMATGRASLRSILQSSSRSDLGVVVGILNDLLEHDMDESHFMTFFLARMEPGGSRLEFVSAGHDQPLIYRAGSGDIESLESSGMPLGLFPDQDYSVQQVDGLGIDDLLVLTTDGVWEAPNARKERFGKERLEELLREHASRRPAEIATTIREEVVRFSGRDDFDDDFTLVVIKRVSD